MLTQRSFFLNFVATITLILSATSSHALSPAVDGENNPLRAIHQTLLLIINF